MYVCWQEALDLSRRRAPGLTSKADAHALGAGLLGGDARDIRAFDMDIGRGRRAGLLRAPQDAPLRGGGREGRGACRSDADLACFSLGRLRASDERAARLETKLGYGGRRLLVGFGEVVEVDFN